MINVCGQGTTASEELQLPRQPSARQSKSFHQQAASSRLGVPRHPAYCREPRGTAWVAGAKGTQRTGRREVVSAKRYVPRLVTETDAGPQLGWGLEAVSRSLLSKNSSSSGANTAQNTATTNVTHTHAKYHVLRICSLNHHSNSRR